MSTVSFNIHLPDYEVLAELGRGNTRVLKARHLPSGDLVAIKQYAFTADADTLRRFERESQIMTQIDHPNVVRVREVQLGATLPYVVMDFVEGGDLRSLLREEGALDVPTTIRLGLQLTGAFRAMHSLQVIHRDIKPENILYRRMPSGELHILLTDFGIAKFWLDDTIRTLTGQSLMTYEYAAPEQFDNPRQVDEAVDYYALGVVLYECLTGKVPFVLDNERGLSQFIQQVLTAPMPVFTTASGQPLPPSLATLLLCLLARNPQDRLRNADQLALLLEQSRVEHLSASWSVPTLPAIRPITDPVMTGVHADGRVSESAGGRRKSTSTGIRRWWVEICIIVAAGVAFGLYNRTMHQLPDKPSAETDSVSRKLPGPAHPNKKSLGVSSITGDGKTLNPDQNPDVDTVRQVRAEPVQASKPPADSAAVVSPEKPIADSAAVSPPDTTH